MRSNNLVQLYITNMCNSHCKTCSIWQNKKCEELSFDVICKAVNADRNADFVIGGGEAILHSQIEDILYYLYAEGINYTLLSNCILLNKLKDLVKRYNVPSVTVSFDGLLHDEIRGAKDNKHKIVDFVEWAKQSGVSFKLSYTLSAYNEKSFLEDMDFIKSLGVDKVYFCLAQNMDLLHTGTDEVVPHNIGKVLLRKDMLFDKDAEFIESVISGNRRKCDSQESVFTVYSNGDVVRCQSFLSSDVVCNLYKHSLRDYIYNVCSVDCPFDGKCNLLCQRRYD